MRSQNQARVERNSASLHRLKEKIDKEDTTPRSPAETVKPFHEINVKNFGQNFDQPIQLSDARPAFISFTPPRRVDSPPSNLRLSESEWKEASYSPSHIERHDAGALHDRALVTGKGKPFSFALRYRLFVGTGLTSAELRTLCKSRLVQMYFRFALILFPPSSRRRFLAFWQYWW